MKPQEPRVFGRGKSSGRAAEGLSWASLLKAASGKAQGVVREAQNEGQAGVDGGALSGLPRNLGHFLGNRKPLESFKHLIFILKQYLCWLQGYKEAGVKSHW